jgi:hypothetical protein
VSSWPLGTAWSDPPALRHYSAVAKDNPGDLVIEAAPARIWLHDLREMLKWYEDNLCGAEFTDPREDQVKFPIERFLHFIKLRQKGSLREITKDAQKHIEAIRSGTKTLADYHDYELYRVQTFPQLSATVLRPTKILELIAQPLLGPKRKGDTLYVKQFANVSLNCRFKILVCRRVGPRLLNAIASHTHSFGEYPAREYKQIYP